MLNLFSDVWQKSMWQSFIHLPPMGLQSMWESSQLLGQNCWVDYLLSHFPYKFSTLFINKTFIQRDFPYLSLDVQNCLMHWGSLYVTWSRKGENPNKCNNSTNSIIITIIWASRSFLLWLHLFKINSLFQHKVSFEASATDDFWK